MRIFAHGVGRKLAWATAASIALPWTAGEWVKRWQQADGFARDPMRAEMIVDFIVAGSIVAALSLLLAFAVGCWVTAVMKGPHYRADSLPVDSPREH